jgi:hypothetical protein
MIILKTFRTVIFLLIAILMLQCKPETKEIKAASGNYIWKSVQVAGGGFVDGIIFYPTEKNLRYARTDMGGAYRWSIFYRSIGQHSCFLPLGPCSENLGAHQ